MKMPRLLSSPRTLLALMLVMGVVIFGMRINDVWESITSGRLIAPVAHAETKTDAKPEEKKETKTEAPVPTASPAAPAPEIIKPAENTTAPTSNLASGTLVPPVDDESSPAEMEVLKQLSVRRVELDKRSKSLDMRESLVKIAEQRVDQKNKELQTLRLQLQSMIGQLSETQAAQLDNLVKVYETMKPEEAAKILETLDMPILLNVIQRMKAKNTAPIMAKMTPEKAKDITMALTKQDQLPQVK